MSVPKKQMVKMMRAIEKVPEDELISVEFVLTALFPTMWKNMQESLQYAYDTGFKEGYTQGELNAD